MGTRDLVLWEENHEPAICSGVQSGGNVLMSRLCVCVCVCVCVRVRVLISSHQRPVWH
jgi:hypothetical protein